VKYRKGLIIGASLLKHSTRDSAAESARTKQAEGLQSA
jgi:hypothetical protein